MVHEVNVLDQLVPEAGAFYIMDRGFLDFERLFRFHAAGSFFVIRGKSNLKVERRYSRKVDRSTGIFCDQSVMLTGFCAQQDFRALLRRIRFRDPKTGKRLIFLTNNFALPPLTIANLYRCRWQVELFFKWIKQHLRIKQFYGTSENAVKTAGFTGTRQKGGLLCVHSKSPSKSSHLARACSGRNGAGSRSS